MLTAVAAAATGIAALVGIETLALTVTGRTLSTFVDSAASADSIGSGWGVGSLTAAGTAASGVPSTGQKLNLSANSSWHVLQNFIFTTSLSRVGLNAKSDTEPPLLLC